MMGDPIVTQNELDGLLDGLLAIGKRAGDEASYVMLARQELAEAYTEIERLRHEVAALNDRCDHYEMALDAEELHADSYAPQVHTATGKTIKTVCAHIREVAKHWDAEARSEPEAEQNAER